MNGKPLNHNDFSYRQNRGPNGVIEPKAEALSLIQLSASQSARMPLKHRSNVQNHNDTHPLEASSRPTFRVDPRSASVAVRGQLRRVVPITHIELSAAVPAEDELLIKSLKRPAI